MEKKIILTEVEDKCKIDATILEKNTPAILTIDIEKHPLQKELLGKKVGYMYKNIAADCTYVFNEIYKVESEEDIKIHNDNEKNGDENCIHTPKNKVNNDYKNYFENEENNGKGYDKFKNSRKVARDFLEANGFIVNKCYTLSSNNKTVPVHWSNPSFECLKHNWTLILNDINARKLHVFDIPKNSLSREQMRPRNDKEISIKINYNDSSFTDTQSGISFKKFFVGSIDY